MAKRNEIVKSVLLYLAETSKDLAKLGVDIVFDPHSLMKAGYSGLRYSPEQIRQFRYRMKRNQCFQKRRNGTYALTSLGRARTLGLAMEKKLANMGKHWNGTWLVVVFDIPEFSRKDRERLWTQLRLLHFMRIQKSVWATPLDIEEELLALLKLWRLEMRGDVRIMRVKHIVRDNDLKRYFKLEKRKS